VGEFVSRETVAVSSYLTSRYLRWISLHAFLVSLHGWLGVEIKDLAPSIDGSGNYEGFQTLVDRANAWLREQRNVQIVNMQSLMVQEMKQGRFSWRWSV